MENEQSQNGCLAPTRVCRSLANFLLRLHLTFLVALRPPRCLDVVSVPSFRVCRIVRLCCAAPPSAALLILFLLATFRSVRLAPLQDKPPGECQELLGPVLRSLTIQLSNPAPWLSRELRNPLAAFEAPPTVRVPSATALCASRICSTAAYVARCAPPLGPILLLDHRVLWSSLQAEETADVHALLQLGAIAAPPTTAPILAPAGAPRRLPTAAEGAGGAPGSDEVLGPGLCWQQVALSTGAGLDCEPRLWVWREPTPAHGGAPTSHPAGSSVRGVPRGWLREASGERRCFTLAMLVFGRLLMVVPMDLAASAMDVATLHACVLPEVEILQKMVRLRARGRCGIGWSVCSRRGRRRRRRDDVVRMDVWGARADSCRWERSFPSSTGEPPVRSRHRKIEEIDAGGRLLRV